MQTRPHHNRSLFRGALIVGTLLLAAIIVPMWLQHGRDSASLTVYCAHDSAFADEIIRLFEQRTGISVSVRYDEEANKSLGLTNLLIQERDSPRCDVFWNNQTLGTMRLMQEGVLQPYHGRNAERFPAQYRDPDGNWTGFAGRLRVFIVNTERMAADESTVAKALQQQRLSDAAIALPLFGTTLSHYTILCSETGIDGVHDWHRSLRDRGIREVRGNSAVKDLVAEGVCSFGYTDTDDAFAALDDAKPVAILPVRLPSGRTICIPNSVAMIRNCSHPDAAATFIDFLLSEEVELLLARSSSRQIPLGRLTDDRLPEEVSQLVELAGQGAPLSEAADCSDQILKWLSAEYVPQ